MNFDNHHPTRYSLDILYFPLFHDNDEVTEPESQFYSLPHEINLEVIHGQESGSPPPEMNVIEDEIDIQQITSESPHQTNPLHNVQDEINLAPNISSMDKILNTKPSMKQTNSKGPKKHAAEIQDEFSSTYSPLTNKNRHNRKNNKNSTIKWVNDYQVLKQQI